MKCFKLKALCFCILLTSTAFSQTAKKQLAAKRIQSTIKIDGVLDDADWKDAQVADHFIALRPTPFVPESADNATKVYSSNTIATPRLSYELLCNCSL